MGLAAALSNAETTALYQRLTKRDWRQVKRAAAKPRDRARDGKLKFGTVSGALLQVLSEADATLRFIEIHARVESLLGFPVSRSSVKQLLSAEAGRRAPRFERVARGRYRLIRNASLDSLATAEVACSLRIDRLRIASRCASAGMMLEQDGG